jgi:hypothetical protein
MQGGGDESMEEWREEEYEVTGEQERTGWSKTGEE